MACRRWSRRLSDRAIGSSSKAERQVNFGASQIQPARCPGKEKGAGRNGQRIFYSNKSGLSLDFVLNT